MDHEDGDRLNKKSFFGQSKLFLGFVLLILLGLGIYIRLYDLTDPPLDFHPTRQLRSAIIARSMYYRSLPETENWDHRAFGIGDISCQHIPGNRFRSSLGGTHLFFTILGDRWLSTLLLNQCDDIPRWRGARYGILSLCSLWDNCQPQFST